MAKSDIKYEFLAMPFKEWVWQKLETYFVDLESNFFYGETHANLLKSLKMTESEFTERFLSPYKGLTINELIAVAKIQTELCHKNLKIPVTFQIKPYLDQYMNSLEWTISNIADLEWFDFDEELKLFYKEPYGQCLYCGQLYHDRRSPAKPFGEDNLLRCHTKECFPIIEDKDTEEHSPDCCADQWERKTHNLRMNLKRIMGKNRGLELNEKSAMSSFINFCEERFQFNKHSLRLTINTMESVSKEIGPYDDLKK